MDCSMTGSSVLHYLPVFVEIHAHWVSDSIQPSHPLPPPSHFALNLSQHQSLFQRVGSLYQVAKVSELQLQTSVLLMDNLGLISFRIYWIDFLAAQESSPAPQFESISSVVLNFLYGPILTSVHDYWKNHSFDYMDLCKQSDVWFLICCLGLSQLSFQGASIFWFHGCSHCLHWFWSPRR